MYLFKITPISILIYNGKFKILSAENGLNQGSHKFKYYSDQRKIILAIFRMHSSWQNTHKQFVTIHFVL
jgi:hypothetical protein